MTLQVLIRFSSRINYGVGSAHIVVYLTACQGGEDICFNPYLQKSTGKGWRYFEIQLRLNQLNLPTRKMENGKKCDILLPQLVALANSKTRWTCKMNRLREICTRITLYQLRISVYNFALTSELNSRVDGPNSNIFHQPFWLQDFISTSCQLYFIPFHTAQLQTPIYELYVVKCGSVSKHQKEIALFRGI